MRGSMLLALAALGLAQPSQLVNAQAVEATARKAADAGVAIAAVQRAEGWRQGDPADEEGYEAPDEGAIEEAEPEPEESPPPQDEVPREAAPAASGNPGADTGTGARSEPRVPADAGAAVEPAEPGDAPLDEPEAETFEEEPAQ